jgi:hypothetical protein
MPFVSITRLRVRSWRYLPMFVWYALISARQAARAEGHLIVRLLRDRRNTFWTATSWTTEAAMKKYVLASPHKKAMIKLQYWCDEAAVVHWNQEGSELPTWPDACVRLQRDGRKSKVNRPSPVHTAHKFPEPIVSSTAEFRFK